MLLSVSSAPDIATNKTNPEAVHVITNGALENLLFLLKVDLVSTNFALLVKKWPLNLTQRLWVILIDLRLVIINMPRKSVKECTDR